MPVGIISNRTTYLALVRMKKIDASAERTKDTTNISRTISQFLTYSVLVSMVQAWRSTLANFAMGSS